MISKLYSYLRVGVCVSEALLNALRGRQLDFNMPRGLLMRLTRNSLSRVRVHSGAAIFAFFVLRYSYVPTALPAPVFLYSKEFCGLNRSYTRLEFNNLTRLDSEISTKIKSLMVIAKNYHKIIIIISTIYSYCTLYSTSIK